MCKLYTPIIFFLLALALPARAQLTANFTTDPSPATGCAPLIVQFNDASTGTSSHTTYSWDLSVATSTAQNPSTTFSTPGTYTIKLTITDGTTSSSKTITSCVTVYAPPTVNFTASPRTGCPCLNVNFSDASTPNSPGTATYRWDFNDGTSSTSQNPTKCFPTGYHKIGLQVTNGNGCVASAVKDSFIYVFGKPTAVFSASNTHFCRPTATASFLNSSSGGIGTLHYNWNFGDLGTSTGTTPTHDYLTTGTFTVSLVATDSNGCKDTAVKNAYINVHKPTASFTGPTSGCAKDSITFTNTSTGGFSSSTWYFGAAGTASSTDGTFAFPSSGTYQVKLVVFDGYCYDTATKNITITALPTAHSAHTPLYPCDSPQTINFTGTGGTTYTWDYGDGYSGTGSTPSHTYGTYGIFYPVVTATSSAGCKGSYMDTVAIYDINQIIIRTTPRDKGCAPLTITFSANVVTSIPFFGIYPYYYSFSWDFGDTHSGSGFTIAHTFVDTGVFTVTLTVTTIGGCVKTQTIPIYVGDHPTAGFTALDTSCADRLINFVNTSTHAENYVWDFKDNSVPYYSKNVLHGFSDSGTYNVTLVAYYHGCPDTFRKKVNILLPHTFFLDSTLCPPNSRLTIYFNDTGSVGLDHFTWYFGDGDSAVNISKVPHTYAGYGIYYTKLVGINYATGCWDTSVLTLNVVNPKLTIKALTDTNICVNTPITFTSLLIDSATGNILTPIGWGWSIQDTALKGIGTNSPTITDTFRKRGCYTILLSVEDQDRCGDTVSRQHYVTVGKPTAGFKATPLTGCTPLNVTFTDTSKDVPCANIAKRMWDFGTGDTAITGNATKSYTYKYRGRDSVSLIVVDNIGCKDTVKKLKYIVPLKPIANFTVSNPHPCKWERIYFSNGSTVDTAYDTLSTYYWTFGDGDTSTLFEPNHAYKDTGKYNVTLIVKDVHGCRDTIKKTGYITITGPRASFTIDDSVKICTPLFVQFTSTSTGASSYTWDVGDGTTPLYIAAPSHLYGTTGYFTVKLVVADVIGCKDTAIGHVNIYGYSGGLSYFPDSGCAPLFVNFAASVSNAPIIIWDFNDGYTQSLIGTTSTTHTYKTPGAYVPKLILSDGKGCKGSNSGLDTIKVDGIIAGFKTSPPCIGSTVTFYDTSHSLFSKETAWSWNFYDSGITSTLQNPSKYYDSAGTFQVSLIVTNAHGCKDTLQDSVVIYNLPVIDAGNDTVICLNDAATLMPAGGVSYSWSPATDLSCTSCTHPQANPKKPFTYTVTGTDVHGCKNTDTVHIGIKTKATGMVDSAGDLCQQLGEYLRAYGAHDYTWIPSTGLSNPDTSNPYASPNTTTDYIVIGREGSCIPDTSYVTVVVHPKPKVHASGAQTIIEGSKAQLQATGTYVTSYEWSPAASLTCSTCSNPLASPVTSTTYTVVGISDFGCKDTDAVTVKIICDKSQVFIPNSFTPNGDGQNDVFYPRGVGITKVISFRIYNRWGEMIFEKDNVDINDASSGWGGDYKGAQQGPGVYVYTMDALCENGQQISWKGDVTIIR
ncbi:MAG: PKD domain-containing protein [Taibaiella sp.]|nr:PKD domain-containing protein [Taibaiella sp.]